MTTTSTPLDSLAQQIARQQTELEALRQEYQTRQTRLAELNRRKEELAAQLQQVEADIQAVDQGNAPSAAAPGPKAPRAASAAATSPPAATRPTLGEVLVDILRQAGGPRTASQLAEELVRRKVPTSSKNIVNLVQNRLSDLVGKGILRRASGQPGVVLAGSVGGQQTPAARTAAPKAESKDGSAVPAATSSGKPAGRQKVPLREILAELLVKSQRPLVARELAEQALASGYQTKSKSFTDVVQVMLGLMPNVENVRGQGYRFKKRPKAGK